MNATRGIHFCDLCPPAEHSASSVVSARARGNAEIRVVGADGTRYAAPTLLHHYVLVHGYGPPQEFVDALMRSAHVAWATAKAEDLCLGCGSPMRRTGSAPATYGGERVTCVSLDCETCGTSYQRRWPSE
jgi:hypothetical protein